MLRAVQGWQTGEKSRCSQRQPSLPTPSPTNGAGQAQCAPSSSSTQAEGARSHPATFDAHAATHVPLHAQSRQGGSAEPSSSLAASCCAAAASLGGEPASLGSEPASLEAVPASPEGRAGGRWGRAGSSGYAGRAQAVKQVTRSSKVGRQERPGCARCIVVSALSWCRHAAARGPRQATLPVRLFCPPSPRLRRST
jgi:hypothetical protein